MNAANEPLRARLSATQAAAYDAIAAQSVQSGVQVYLVGGAVRDWLLGAPSIDDLDFAVDGDAIELARALRATHGGELTEHAMFKTTRWLWRGESIDLAMTRSERYERPAALPTVTAAPIDIDLCRRDFTVNAIALRLSDSMVLDPFDGASDITKRVLRGLHESSFVDDPTRLLRGARYASRLGFAVDVQTRSWIDMGVRHLRELSGERIKYDFELIFQDRQPADALSLLRNWQVFSTLGIPAPEAQQLRTRFEQVRAAFAQAAFPTEGLERDTGQLLAAAGWGALTYNLGQLPARRWMDRIAFEVDLRDALIESGPLSTAAPAMFSGAPSTQSVLLQGFGGLTLWLGYLFDSNLAKRAAMRDEWREWRWVRPHTTGEDLKALGLPPGPRYKTLLDRLRAARLDGDVSTAEQEHTLLQRLLRA